MVNDHIMKDMVHHCLECSGGVSESEEHNYWFVKSVTHFERCFILISLFDAYIVVSPMNVKLRIDTRMSEVSNEIGYEGKRVLIVNHYLI